MSSHFFELLKVKGFIEADQEELEAQVVYPFDGIGHLVASVSFSPGGGKMVLGPEKDAVRCIDCKPVTDYSDWETFCLVKVQDPPYDPRLLIVRQSQLVKPSIN